MAVPRRPALIGLAQVVLGGLAGFLLVDRVVEHVDEGARGVVEGLHEPHPQLGWVNKRRYRSERITTNGATLRGTTEVQELPASSARLLALGDSRIFGGGVRDEEVWSRHLQRLLDERGVPVAVLNGGVNAYSTVQSCRRGVMLLEELEVDAAVLFVSPGQNLVDNSAAGEWIRVAGDYVPRDVLDGWPAALRPAVAALHGWLSSSAIYLRQRAVRRVGGDRAEEVKQFVLSRADLGPATPFVEAARRALGELAAAARAAGVPVRVLLLPEGFQVVPAVWRRYLRDHAAAGAPPPGTDRLEPMAALADLVEDAGLSATTMFDEIARLVADEDRYFLDDYAHWSPAGHVEMARALDDVLQRTGLLDRAIARRAAR